MNTPSIICTSNSITVVFDGGCPKVITLDSPNYTKCKEAIRERDWNKLYDCVSIEESLRAYTSESGKIRIANGAVYYENDLLNGLIIDRILQFMQEDFPFEPLVKFIENMMLNTSMRARNELYNFLEHEGLPVTEDGCFLAYKAVRGDYYDQFSGTIYNGIGVTVKMNRPKVDDDCTRGCSYGLHAGSLSYVRGYGSSSSKFLIVKINPKDVVSVPSEDSRKLRCCEYIVLSEFKQELDKACYSSDGGDFSSCDEDFDDFDDLEDDCDSSVTNNQSPKTRGDGYDYYSN
jgi:hypothetical protein